MKKKVRLVFLVIFTFFILGASYVLLKSVLFPMKYSDYVIEYSNEYDLDPMLVMAVMKAESNFNPNVVSDKAANGLMQITGDTGQWIAEKLDVTNFQKEMLKDPEVNIRFGCWYLRYLLDESESEEIAIAAYNAGIGNVQKWLGDPRYSKNGDKLDYIPFKETDKYVKKVEAYKNIYKTIYD